MYVLDGKFWVASKEAPTISLLLFLALAHEAIAANAPPELFNRVTYVGKPTRLTTNVYFQHTYQSPTLPRRRFAFSADTYKCVPTGTRTYHICSTFNQDPEYTHLLDQQIPIFVNKKVAGKGTTEHRLN